MKDTFKSVKNDLNNDMYVMFSGTACQVAGLKRYLGKCDTSKLYTCDIACHGVPSPIIWKEYLKHCEKKFCGKVTKADFRDKTTRSIPQKSASVRSAGLSMFEYLQL